MKKNFFEIRGCIETGKDLDTWLDEFIDWIESRKEYFGGGIKPCDDEED